MLTGYTAVFSQNCGKSALCMLEILQRIDAESTDIGLMVELFDTLRPKRPNDGVRATANVRTLAQLLKLSLIHI